MRRPDVEQRRGTDTCVRERTEPCYHPQQTPAAQQPAGTVNPTAPTAAQAQTVQNDTTGNPALPQAPQPKLTEPLYLRPSGKDYTEPIPFWPNPFKDYTATNYPAPRLSNTPDLRDLLRDGKIYLGLDDAVTLALENNYDIAIARINLDIADTDILRAKAGSSAAWCFDRNCGEYAGRIDLDDYGRRRTGRNDERGGRRRRGRGWPGAEHDRRRTNAGAAGPAVHGDAAVSTPRIRRSRRPS